MSDQKGLRVDKDTDKDFNNIFIYIWDSLKVRRGSKKLALEKFKKIKDIDAEVIITKYNKLCDQASDDKYIPHFCNLAQPRTF